MSAITQDNGRNRQRLTLWGLVAAGIAFAMWRMILPSGPELVLELEQRNAGAGAITNGQTYSLKSSNSGVTIESLDLATKEKRDITGVNTSGTLVEQQGLTNWCGHFIAVPHQPSSAPPRYAMGGSGGGQMSGGRQTPGKPLGEFLFTDNKPLGTGERRVVQTLVEPRIRCGKLHIVTLPDGQHRIAEVDTLGEPLQRLSRVLTRTALYWVRNRDRRTVTV